MMVRFNGINLMWAPKKTGFFQGDENTRGLGYCHPRVAITHKILYSEAHSRVAILIQPSFQQNKRLMNKPKNNLRLSILRSDWARECLGSSCKPFFFQAFFLIKQLVVNSKKIGGSAAGQTKRIEKNRSLLVFFEYSINHNNRTSV